MSVCIFFFVLDRIMMLICLFWVRVLELLFVVIGWVLLKFIDFRCVGGMLEVLMRWCSICVEWLVESF